MRRITCFPRPTGPAAFFGHATQAWLRRTLLAQLLELAFVLLLDVQWIGPQGLLHATLGIVHLVLNLGGRQIIRTAGLGHRRLALNDVQRALALGRPALDLAFHLHAHRLFSHYDVG